MKFLDYFLYKIYKTYRQLHKRVPGLVFSGPRDQATWVAALYPMLLAFSVSTYTRIWNAATETSWRFMFILFLILVLVAFQSYFQRKISQAVRTYSRETVKQSWRGAVLINLVIIVILTFLVISIIANF